MSSTNRKLIDRTADAGSPVRLLIADDHAALRQGLIAIAETVSHFRVVAEAADGNEAVLQFERFDPDVTILDLRMPGLDGLKVMQRIVEIRSDARVLVMTMYDHEEDIFRSVQLGARGYLLKSATRDEIVDAIEKVARGDLYMPDYVALKLAAHMSTPELTSREREVLELMHLGISNKNIGAELHLTEGTVKTHVRAIMSKLNAISRTEAILLAAERGLLRHS